MKAKLLAKKKRQKALFNSGGLDSTKEEKTYYEMQREEMQKQAEVRGQPILVLLLYILLFHLRNCVMLWEKFGSKELEETS